MGKGPGKSRAHTSSLQPRGPVGENAPCLPPQPCIPPQGSALNLSQLQALSHSLSPLGQHFHLSISLSPSRPPALPHSPCLFTFSIPLSHFLVPCDCPAPSHSYPLTDRLSVGACSDGLFPRAAGLNQLQFEMKAGGGGGGARLAGEQKSQAQCAGRPARPTLQRGSRTHVLFLCLSFPPRHIHKKFFFKRKIYLPQTNKQKSPIPKQAAGSH